jgi:hypothetical protein
VPIVLKSESLKLLETSGPVKACNGIALLLLTVSLLWGTSESTFLFTFYTEALFFSRNIDNCITIFPTASPQPSHVLNSVFLHTKTKRTFIIYNNYFLWLCSPARAMASCGSAAQRGLWPPHPQGFVVTHNDAPQSVGLLWTSD